MLNLDLVLQFIKDIKNKERLVNFAGLESFHGLVYKSTPMNCIPFAFTGGDGTHYSILNYSIDFVPIVITCPMNCGIYPQDDNIIIAENISEFLSIGFYNGWFSLEQLFYDKVSAIDYYSKEDMDTAFQNSDSKVFIKMINSYFKTNHIPLSEERLNELKLKYFDFLEFAK